MKPIGGFFELEIPNGNSIYHDDALALSTGRACQRLAFKMMKIEKVYLPYYCCDALFEPCLLDEIEFEFYEIDENLEIKNLIQLKERECLVFTNFFGVKQSYISRLIEVYKDKLLIDDTHSFYNKGYSSNYSFTSARKYFGVPDGAFLYTPKGTNTPTEFPRNNSISAEHNINRLIGKQKIAYNQYQNYEKTLGSKIELISLLSERLLKSIDYDFVKARRVENYNYLHSKLQDINQLKVDFLTDSPFCYPLLLEKPIDKEILFDKNIFVPDLWLDTENRVNKNKFDFECALSRELLPLPIDHRYSIDDMKKLIDIIIQFYE